MVGLVYVGPRDDFGWNQAHAVAAKALKAVPGVKVVEEENVPETVAVAKSMESMINLDGANLIFATSFGYFDPFVVDTAKKFPDVQFRHAAPLWSKDKHPMNAGSYFGYLEPGATTSTASPPACPPPPTRSASSPPSRSPRCCSNVNSVLLGARKTNPKAVVQVVFTGEWSMPVREAEATNALVDSGCDVITCHVDSPKVVIETAEKRGVKTCGHNASQAPLAPKGFITGAEYKWETIYKAYAANLAKGETLPNFFVGGYHEGHGAEHAVRRRRQRSGARGRDRGHRRPEGQQADLRRPAQGQQGQAVVIDKTYDNYDPFLDGMNYLLEGVVGSIT